MKTFLPLGVPLGAIVALSLGVAACDPVVITETIDQPEVVTEVPTEDCSSEGSTNEPAPVVNCD